MTDEMYMYMVYSVTDMYSVTDVWYPKFSKLSGNYTVKSGVLYQHRGVKNTCVPLTLQCY